MAASSNTRPYQPLDTTPAVHTMEDNLARNLARILGRATVPPAAPHLEPDQGEETEYVDEEDGEEEVERAERRKVHVAPVPRANPLRGEGGQNAGPQMGMWTLPPGLKGKTSSPSDNPALKARDGGVAPKIYIPARIWNEVSAGDQIQEDDDEEKEEEEEAKPKNKTRKRSRFDSHLEQSSQEPSTSRHEPLPKRIKPPRPSPLATASSSKPALPLPEASPPPPQNPYSRSHQYHNQRSTPLPCTTTTTTTTKPKSKPKTPRRPTPLLPTDLRPFPIALFHPLPVPAPTLTPGPRSDYEGPRAAWRRLFPELECEMSEYKGVPDAWHEKMVWEREGGWRARRTDGSEVYVRRVLGVKGRGWWR